MDTQRTSISDADHYGLSAPIRLRCAELILATLEKLRARPIGVGDRVLDLGCGLKEMLDPLWVSNKRNPDYVLGLDVDFGGVISNDVANEGSQWGQFTHWGSTNRREFVQSDALEWEPPENIDQFSVIYSGSALHWIVAGEQPPGTAVAGEPVNGKALFNKINGALKPGGWFVAHSPGCENFYPLFTRIIIAALNNIKCSLSSHDDEEVRNLASLPDIHGWLNENNDSKIEDGGGFDQYWAFRRKARVAFWKDYDAIRNDFKETGLHERLLLRGLDWELVSTDEFYSHWASAGKSVFWGRFRSVAERGAGAGCDLYDEFERAFKSILKDDGKLKNLGVSPLYIEGKKYIRHYCHRYYIILQKPEPNERSQHIGVSPITSLPIRIVRDVATLHAPPFEPETNEKSKFEGEGLKWLQPFRSLKECLPVDSMKYGMFLREGRSDVDLGKSLQNTDRRALLLHGQDSIDAQWQYKIDELLGRNVKIAQFTSMLSIATNALPVCVVVGSKESLPNRISEMMTFTHSQHPKLDGEATPVFIVASTTNPRTNIEKSPVTLDVDAYRNLLDGATGNEIREPVSFMFYSSESVYDELRQIENEDVGALSFLRALRWHGSVAFPCAFVLGHTAAPSAPTKSVGKGAIKSDVRFASASVLLGLNDDTIPLISFTDMALIGGSLRIMSLWDQVAAERDLRQRIAEASSQSALAAIMSRNMSHNIGSHVLSQIDDSAMGNKEDIQSLHAYLQRRMDLVARITSRNPDWGEPMWFFGDLVRGFLSQTILLDTLVRDQGGWGNGKGDGKQLIKFFLHKNGKVDEIAPTNRTTKQDGIDIVQAGWFADGIQFDDFLVSIPDGAIGAQAFYVFLESMMRNSAKYGEAKKSANTFDIHLEITEVDGKGYYEIGIWDTLSTCPTDGGQELCGSLQGKIQESLTNEKGQLSASSLGIAEMKAACDFLIHPFGKKYPVRCLDTAVNGKGCNACTGQKDKSQMALGDSAADAKGADEKEPWPLWVECYAPRFAEDDKKYLRYRLHLAIPKMVGIVGYEGDEITLPEDAGKLGIVKLSDKEKLKGAEGAFQFVVIMVEDAQLQSICEWIDKNHSHLPQRLLLVNDKGTNGCSLKLEGRVVWCSMANIFGNGEGSVDSKSLIVNVYKTWIRKKWLKEDERVTLHVSYERPNAPSQWSKLDDIMGLEFATIVVWSRPEGNGWKKEFEKNNELSSLVSLHYFNSHGADASHSDIATTNVVRFKNGDLTCELLFTPPSSTFGLRYFLLGLIEAALIKVSIVDERVALWVVEPGPDIASIRSQNARGQNVEVVFKYDASAFLTKGLENYSTKRTSVTNPITAENSEKNTYPEEIFTALNNRTVDLVVLHVGVAETADKVNLFAAGTAEEARNNAPIVVMMSGRGGLKERTAGDMPFIEYSAVRQCFSHTGNISKYHLAKSLMSAKSNSQ